MRDNSVVYRVEGIGVGLVRPVEAAVRGARAFRTWRKGTGDSCGGGGGARAGVRGGPGG